MITKTAASLIPIAVHVLLKWCSGTMLAASHNGQTSDLPANDSELSSVAPHFLHLYRIILSSLRMCDMLCYAISDAKNP